MCYGFSGGMTKHGAPVCLTKYQCGGKAGRKQNELGCKRVEHLKIKQDAIKIPNHNREFLLVMLLIIISQTVMFLLVQLTILNVQCLFIDQHSISERLSVCCCF